MDVDRCSEVWNPEVLLFVYPSPALSPIRLRDSFDICHVAVPLRRPLLPTDWLTSRLFASLIRKFPPACRLRLVSPNDLTREPLRNMCQRSNLFVAVTNVKAAFLNCVVPVCV